MITPPNPGEPVDELWIPVAELCKAMNAMMNLTVVIQTSGENPPLPPTKGKLTLGDGGWTLVLY